jgi:hypothetical protein
VPPAPPLSTTYSCASSSFMSLRRLDLKQLH